MTAGAVLGAIIGSFIATLAIRWPRGSSAAQGRSACDGCGVTLSSARLIPIISYALQRGRAACCGMAIDRVHPLAEIIAAVIGAVAIAVAADLPQAMAGALFGWLLLVLALLDARHFWLPDPLTAGLAVAALAVGLADIPPALPDRLIGGVIGVLSLTIVRHGYRLLRKREGMGGGDAKLFGAIGLWLGWRLLPIVLLGAALAGLLWCLLELVRGRPMTGLSSVPFGVFLALAAWVAWVAGAAGWLALLA